jgi:hypothetical protein
MPDTSFFPSTILNVIGFYEYEIRKNVVIDA